MVGELGRRAGWLEMGLGRNVGMTSAVGVSGLEGGGLGAEGWESGRKVGWGEAGVSGRHKAVAGVVGMR